MQNNIQQSTFRVQIPLLNGLKKTFSKGDSLENLQNLYLEQNENGRSGGFITQFPGTREVFDAGTGTRIKGLGIELGSSTANVIYAVSGTKIIRLSIDVGNIYGLTTTDTDTASNFNTTSPVQVIVGPTDGDVLFLEMQTGVAYVRDSSTGNLTQITDADFPSAAHTGTFIDGYFIVSRRSNPSFYISNLNDPLNWTATDFATAESVGDDIVAIDANETYLWLFGRNSIELWVNTGNADFPFERVPNAVMRIGLIAPLAKTRVFGQFCILASSDSGGKKVMMFNGTSPTTISTSAVENVLKRIDLTKIAGGYDLAQNANNNIVLNTFENRGHTFLVLRVPATFDTQSNGFILVYDFLTQKWIEVPGLNIGEGVVNLAGVTYCTSGTEDTVYIIDENEFTHLATSAGNDGFALNRIITTQYLHDVSNNLIVHSLELTIDLPDAGNVPISLEVSKDFGQTFSTVVTRTATNAGRNRLRWHRLGKGRDIVFRLSNNGSQRFNVIALEADIQQLGF